MLIASSSGYENQQKTKKAQQKLIQIMSFCLLLLSLCVIYAEIFLELITHNNKQKEKGKSLVPEVFVKKLKTAAA